MFITAETPQHFQIIRERGNPCPFIMFFLHLTNTTRSTWSILGDAIIKCGVVWTGIFPQRPEGLQMNWVTFPLKKNCYMSHLLNTRDFTTSGRWGYFFPPSFSRNVNLRSAAPTLRDGIPGHYIMSAGMRRRNHGQRWQALTLRNQSVAHRPMQTHGLPSVNGQSESKWEKGREREALGCIPIALLLLLSTDF